MKVTNISTNYYKGTDSVEYQDATSVILTIEASDLSMDMEFPLNKNLKHTAQHLRILANVLEEQCEN